MAKSLQQRVTALEAENREAKHEAAAARAEARDLRKKLGAAPARSTAGAGSPGAPTLAAVSAAPPQAYAMATKAPVMPPVPAWGGLYAGVAFGLGSLDPSVDETSHSVSTSTDVGFAPGPVFSDTFTSVSDFAGSLSGRNAGAIANLFLGYNFLLNNNFVLGGQVEGGVSNIRVNLGGAGRTASTNTTVITPPGGAAGTSVTTSVTNSSLTDQIDNRWMVSVLARAGVLVDPQDLLYAIGGWTYGRFEFGQSFGLNGGTIGGGWERQLVPGWTLKAEGRYTRFESKTLNTASASNTVTSAFNAAGVLDETVTSTSTFAEADRVSASMWSVWLGVSHYFNTY